MGCYIDIRIIISVISNKVTITFRIIMINQGYGFIESGSLRGLIRYMAVANEGHVRCVHCGLGVDASLDDQHDHADVRHELKLVPILSSKTQWF